MTFTKDVKMGFESRFVSIQALTLLSHSWKGVKLERSRGRVALPLRKIANARNPKLSRLSWTFNLEGFFAATEGLPSAGRFNNCVDTRVALQRLLPKYLSMSQRRLGGPLPSHGRSIPLPGLVEQRPAPK